MTELWPTLLPILLADAVNPVLFAFLVYAAGTERPVINSSALLIGHTLSYFAAGLLLAGGLQQITERLSHPKEIDYVIGLVVGIVLLWVALRSRKDTGKRPNETTPDLGPAGYAMFGAVVNFTGIPFALPYFAALSRILQADLPTEQAVVTLIAYNVAYALPFAAVPLLIAVVGERAKPLLDRINAFLDKASAILMPLLLLLLGAALVTDAVYYFATGDQLL